MNSLQASAKENTEILSPDKKRRSPGASFVILIVLLAAYLFAGWSPPLKRLIVVPFKEALTHKIGEVTIAMGTTIAIGVAIDAIPVDSGKQVANKLFDISGLFMIVIGAIIAMKILLGLSVQLSLGIISPIACFLALLCLIKENEVLMNFAKKLAIFALMFLVAIPATVGISMAIDSTFEAERTRLIEQIQQDKEVIDAASSEVQNASLELEGLEITAQNGGFLDKAGKLFDNISKNVSEWTSSVRNTIVGGVNNAMEAAKKNLESLMLIAVQWIVTGCIVPILTLIGFGFVIKLLFGFNINPILSNAARTVHSMPSSISRSRKTSQPKDTKDSSDI